MPVDCEIAGPVYELRSAVDRYREGKESAQSLCTMVRCLTSAYQSVMQWKGAIDEPTKQEALKAVDGACLALRTCDDIVLRFLIQIRRESISQFDPQSVLDPDPAHHFALPI